MLIIVHTSTTTKTHDLYTNTYNADKPKHCTVILITHKHASAHTPDSVRCNWHSEIMTVHQNFHQRCECNSTQAYAKKKMKRYSVG